MNRFFFMAKRVRDPAGVGPSLPSQAGEATRKRKTLAYEELYLAALPHSPRYEVSFMHRSHVSHVAASDRSAFVVSASSDGRINFWKKKSEGIEFVKTIRGVLRVLSLTLLVLVLLIIFFFSLFSPYGQCQCPGPLVRRCLAGLVRQ